MKDKEILRTCLFVDYEELQKKQTQEKMKTATLAFENGSLQNLTREFKVIISSVVIIMGIIGIVAYANVYLMIISCAIIIANYYILKNVKSKQYSADKEIVPIGRQIEYFDNIAADFSIAKEVRLYHTENAIFNDFNNMVSGKTAIYISHRLSASLLADKIIVLNNGVVVEEGKHRNLMNNKGLYAELFNLQAQYYIGEN